VLARAASADAPLRQAALTVLHRHPDWAGEAVELVRGWLQKKALSAEEAASLRGSLLAFQSQRPFQELMTETVVNREGKVPIRQCVLVLEALGESRLPILPPGWVTALKQAIDRGPPEVRDQAVRTAAVLQLPQLDDRLAALAEDQAETAPLRLEALRAVIVRRRQLSQPLFELLTGQLAEEAPPLSRLRAAELLGRAELSDPQARLLLGQVRGQALVSPAVLLPAFPKSMSTATATALLDYLTESLRGGWQPTESALTGVLQKLPASVKGQAVNVVTLLREKTGQQRQMLADLEQGLEGGDIHRGRVVFFSKKVACANCHRVGGEGGEVGPDLTRIGAVRAVRDLLESVVLPSSTLAQGYENYLVTTSSGRALSGVIAWDTAEMLGLRDSSGAEIRVQKKTIESVTRQPTSLMPDGLARAMTREELRDLLAFLRSLR
jgi:putative heme-binding domain-containing protein